MMTRVDQYGRTRITLLSESDPSKTVELSHEHWISAGCPVTAEDAYKRIAIRMLNKRHPQDPAVDLDYTTTNN